MSRYNDIDPMDIDPDTGRPYAGYSSPSIDTSAHDWEMGGDDDDDDDRCTNSRGHEFPIVEPGESSLCRYCGADGAA